MKIHETLDEIAHEICDNYCKYPQHVHALWLSGMIEKEEDKTDYLMEHYCNNCPLTEKL